MRRGTAGLAGRSRGAGWRARWARGLAAGALAWGGLAAPVAGGEPILPGPLVDAEGRLGAGWRPHTFPRIPRHTVYTPERQDGRGVVCAHSEASASGLIHALDLDPGEWPRLRFEWKIEGILPDGDARRKSGDDYAARVYVTFAYEPERVGFWRRAQYLAARALRGDVPYAALTYIWANRLPAGATADSPYAPGFVKFVALRSGGEAAGRWHSELRDVERDYRRAFGAAPPRVNGVALMTDSDDTGGEARACYAALQFLPPRPPDR